MAPTASIAILVASLLSAMAAPLASSPIATTTVAQLNTTYSGYATYFDDHRNACPEIQYSFDEPIVAVNSAMFGNGTSVCGKYVKVNLKNDATKQYTFKVVDVCPECDKTSLDFSKVAIEQFTDSSLVAIDWVLTEAPLLDDKSGTLDKRALASRKEHANQKKHTSKVFRGRGTWFSDTMGSCGVKFSQKDMIVALNQAQMGKMWGKGSKCGQKLRVKAKGSSTTVVVKVVDTCPHKYCSHGQLDLSQAAFKKFAPKSKGILDLEWSFV